MMVQAKDQKGSCVLPSLSSVLQAVAPKDGAAAPALSPQTASVLWTQMQQMHQLNPQQANLFGLQHLLALNSQLAASQVQSLSSGHSEHSDGHSTTSGSPGSPTGECEGKQADAVREGVAGAGKEASTGPVRQQGAAGAKAPKTARGTGGSNAASAAQTDASMYWPGRKWRERRDKKYGGEEKTRDSAHLRVAVQGLVKALTSSEAKTTLLTEMRKYAEGELTPETFAETIQTMVDEHNIMVPAGTLSTADMAANRKRPLSDEQDALPAPAVRAVRARDSKRSNAGSKNRTGLKTGASRGDGPGCKDMSKVKGNMNGNVNKGDAWDALVSICSML